MAQNLAELLEKKSHAASAAPIDWDARRDTYLAAVQTLYREIRTILAGPLKQKTVFLEQRPKQLSENFIGTYSVDDLILLVGNEQVRFSPRGRNVLGAAGRVDVVGERGEAMLILGGGANWEFVRSRQPTLQTEPLTEATLGEILQMVMRD